MQEFLAYINELTGNNQTMAAAIVVCLTGIGGYLLRELPKVIKNFITRRFLTILEFSETDDFSVYSHIHRRINRTISDECNLSRSATYNLGDKWNDETNQWDAVLYIGYGYHIMWFFNKPVFIFKSVENANQGRITTTKLITLKMFKSVFNDIINESNVKARDNRLVVMSFKEGKWVEMSREQKLNIDSLALNPEIKKFFTDEIQFFIDNEKEYHRLNLPYKETILLHGNPGTGKTSLIKALASKFDFNILILPIQDMSDKSLRDAITAAPPKSFILIEDFDSCRAVKDRSTVVKNPLAEELECLTLSGVLNALDGVCSLYKTFIFMTTNVIDSIDPAVLRPGRVNHIVELPSIRKEEVKNYFETLYPALKSEKINYRDMPACKINSVVFTSKLNHVKAKELLQASV